MQAIDPPINARVPRARKQRQQALLFIENSRGFNEKEDPRLLDALCIELPGVPKAYDCKSRFC